MPSETNSWYITPLPINLESPIAALKPPWLEKPIVFAIVKSRSSYSDIVAEAIYVFPEVSSDALTIGAT